MNLDENERLLIIRELSDVLKLPEDLWLSLYAYFGDDLFFLLEVLSGKTVRFPKVNICKTFLDKIYKTKDNVIVQDIKGFVRANGITVSANLVQEGDILDLGDKVYQVLVEPYHVTAKNLMVLKEMQEEE